MNFDITACPFCGDALIGDVHYGPGFLMQISCKTCGPYAMTRQFYDDQINRLTPTISKSRVASYLYYHRNHDYLENPIPCICSKQTDTPEMYRCVTVEEIHNWYPRTFHEKVDAFLLHLASRSRHFSDPVKLTLIQLSSAYFVELYPDVPDWKKGDIIFAQTRYFGDYLKEQGYISVSNEGYILRPSGLARVDELQKSQPKNSKNAFIAMAFAAKNNLIRDAIKEALIACGYVPRIMDEVEHNNQIVPEMLYEIRESRFLVAELSDKNNGAYFEAGYAMGQGKDVIFVCSDEAFASNAHFDVKQANTITWKDPDDLKSRLIARIKATIS